MPIEFVPFDNNNNVSIVVLKISNPNPEKQTNALMRMHVFDTGKLFSYTLTIFCCVYNNNMITNK